MSASPLSRPHLAGGDDQAFRCFAIMGGIAPFFFFSENSFAMLVNGHALPIPIVVPIGLGLCSAVRPKSLFIFLAFWASYAGYLLLGFPANNTNQTLSFFVGLSILAAAVACAARLRTLRVPRDILFRAFAPAVRLSVVLLYFWTIWHKLNTDFINPLVSCAVPLGANMLHALHLGRLPSDLAVVPVVATLVVEGAIPIGLSFRRTQRATVLLAMIFHWLLAWASFFGFSATMVALLVLFLSPPDQRRLLPRGRREMTTVVATVSIAIAIGVFVFDMNRLSVQKLLWLLWPAILVTTWCLHHADPREDSGPESAWRLVQRFDASLLVPLLLFVNGLSPYVGFKTEYSYAMYSNLRTEGGHTNHLIWRQPLRLASYQTDLVSVLDGSDSAFRGLSGRPVTRYEVTSLLWTLVHDQGRSAVRLILDVNRQRLEYPAADRSPELTVPPTTWERRLLRFRRIVPALPGRCEH